MTGELHTRLHTIWLTHLDIICSCVTTSSRTRCTRTWSSIIPIGDQAWHSTVHYNNEAMYDITYLITSCHISRVTNILMTSNIFTMNSLLIKLLPPVSTEIFPQVTASTLNEAMHFIWWMHTIISIYLAACCTSLKKTKFPK